MKHLYFITFCFLIVITNTGCEKDLATPIHFWDRELTGFWKIDQPFMTVNGNRVDLPGLDQEHTFFEFGEISNRYRNTSGGPQSIWRNGDFEAIGHYRHSYNSAVMNGTPLFGLVNDLGLYTTQRNASGYTSLIAAHLYDDLGTPSTSTGYKFQELTDISNRSYRVYNKMTYQGDNHHLHVLASDLDAECDRYGSFTSNSGSDITPEDCVENNGKHLANASEVLFMTTNRYIIKMELLGNNNMRLTIMNFLFERNIGGVAQNDETVIMLKKTNFSGTVDVPPFTPETLDDEIWLNFQSVSQSHRLGTCDDAPDGKIGNCIKFDGNGLSAYYGSGTSATRDISRSGKVDWTLCFWMNTERIDKEYQVITSKYSSEYGPYIISLHRDRLSIAINNGQGTLQAVESNTRFRADRWYFITITHQEDGKTQVFVDGQLDGTGITNSFNYDAEGHVYIGNSRWAIDNNINQEFQGRLDEFVAFDQILNSIEVRLLYEWFQN